MYGETLGMAYNFKSVDRATAYLPPPNMREWLPAKHLAWFIVETVESLDLRKFYLGYRSDGWGRAAYEPKMMTERGRARRLLPRSARERRRADRFSRRQTVWATGSNPNNFQNLTPDAGHNATTKRRDLVIIIYFNMTKSLTILRTAAILWI